MPQTTAKCSQGKRLILQVYNESLYRLNEVNLEILALVQSTGCNLSHRNSFNLSFFNWRLHKSYEKAVGPEKEQLRENQSEDRHLA